MLYFLDLFGTVVFAMTGALVARKKQMDIFGVVVVALVTALGGGTLRDLLLDASPVFWMADPIYIIMGIVGVILTAILVTLNFIPARLLLLADAIGLAVFTVIGSQVALSHNIHWLIAIIMAVMTSVAGGVIRDVLTGEIPLILRREIYASASLLGAIAFVGLSIVGIPQTFVTVIAFTLTLSLRLIAIWRGWSLPLFAQTYQANSS
jgi:uncharacterized membrane protein YeiH